MYNGILSIDHPLIAVSDMEASKITYEKLGFTVPPRGSHIEWGTGNWCIMFQNDYLELRGILDPERYTLGLEEVLENYGEGLAGVAFGTEGAEINFRKMSDNGLQPKPVRYLTRNFELPGEWLQPKFALCFPNETEVTGLMHVVLCEHLTPELTRKPEYLIHPNSTLSILSITGIIDNPTEVEAAQVRLLGSDAVKRVNNSIFLTTSSGQQIKLLSAQDFENEFGDLAKKLTSKSSYLGAITLQVADINKTVNSLESNNIPFEKVNNRTIRVGAKYTCGVVIEFIEQ